MCMRFWTHMFGNGIGALRVVIFNSRTKTDEVIWKLNGEAGNEWYQGQVPIASPDPFKVSCFKSLLNSVDKIVKFCIYYLF